MLDHLKVSLFKCLLKLASWLPLRVCQALGALVGSLMYKLDTRNAKVTRINLGLCFPDMGAAEREQLVHRSLQETGKLILEMGHAWMGSGEKNREMFKPVAGEDVLDKALADPKGVIVAVPHLGNWELLNFYLGHKKPIKALYQPPDSPALDRLTVEARNRMGTQMFPTNAKGVAVLVKALRNGELVGVLPDQEPPASSGVFVNFFGVSALTMTLVSKLAQKTGAPVVMLLGKRLPKGQGFEVHAELVDDDIYHDDLSRSTAALSRGVESVVMKAVEQYQWEYKRFRKDPQGKTGHYKGT